MSRYLALSVLLQVFILFEGCYSAQLGCYSRDTVNFFKVTGGYSIGPQENLTPDVCTSYCSLHDNQYAALQGLDVKTCYCSDERPPYTYITDPSVCNTKKGVTVYNTDEEDGENYVDRNHFSCYQDNKQFTLNDKLLINDNVLMTPELCVGYCYHKGYQYAGLEAGQFCFCGNDVQGTKADRYTFCSQSQCPGNRHLFCGGTHAVDVYQTHTTSVSKKPISNSNLIQKILNVGK